MQLTEHFKWNMSHDRGSYSVSFANDLAPIASQPEREIQYPAIAMPLVARAVDFTKMKQIDFWVILADGVHVEAMIEKVGEERVTTPAGELDTEKLIVHYAHAIPSTFGPRTDRETYWRAKDQARTLLKMEGAGYGLTLEKVARVK